MTGDKKIADIFETRNYEQFVIPTWNRQQTAKFRAKKIRESIRKNGYILSPICVNEKMEIIDGLGRFEALKSLGLPIHYYIEVGAGRQECIAMNTYTSTWTMLDYINSYASAGNENYARYKLLYDDYHELGNDTVYFAATGCTAMQNETVKQGKLLCTQEDYEKAASRLEEVKEFSEAIEHMKDRKKLYQATLFALGCECVDKKILYERIMARYHMVDKVSTIAQALNAIEKIYNVRTKDPIYLVTEYDRYQRGKYAWYGKKWGGDE